MAQYKIGTATFTNGSATVTGTGTAWASNLSAGDYIVRRGDALNTYQAYQIGGINSNISLTLTAPYGGTTASNVAYVAHVDFIDNDRPELSNGDIETAAIMNRWIASIAQLAQLGTAANLDAQTSLTDTTPDRLMKVGAFGLGATSLNRLLATDPAGLPTGIYSYNRRSDGATPPSWIPESHYSTVIPVPSGVSISWGLAYNVSLRTLYLTQNLDGDDGNGSLSNPNALYAQRNILGTVSQSAGVPTGAIIERGSNANGEYVKFADGTMRVTKQVTFSSLAVSTPFGSLFINNVPLSIGSWSANFSQQPEVSIMAYRGVNAPIDFHVGNTEGNTTTAPSGWFASAVSVPSDDFSVFVIAEGRWY